MTGKFHTSWGDFHSLKNVAALEFEAFRMLSFGFACSIGDQLEPCGRLNPLPADWQGIRPVRRARTVGASLHTADRGRAYDRRKRSG